MLPAPVAAIGAGFGLVLLRNMVRVPRESRPTQTVSHDPKVHCLSYSCVHVPELSSGWVQGQGLDFIRLLRQVAVSGPVPLRNMVRVIS